MDIDLNLYRVFLAVADCKSITRAGERLFLSQQAISHSIKTLETALGAKLFFRTPKGVEIMPDARALYATITDALALVEVGERQLRDDRELRSGQIAIACNPSLFQIAVRPLLNDFHAKYPNIKFAVSSNSANESMNMLRERKVDMVVTALNESIDTADFTVKKFAKCDFCFVGNAQYKHLAQGPIDIATLRAQPLLLLNQQSHIRQSMAGFDLAPIMEFTHYDPMLAMCRAGAGIGYTLRDLVADEIRDGALFEIPVRQIKNACDVAIIFDPNYTSLATQTFIAAV